MARSCLSLLGLVLTAAALAQSAPNPAQSPVPTLHATAKLVIVDVVVRDAQHRPIHGLKQGDFILLEAGKAQMIKSFEEFRADMPVKPQPVPKLPPGVFTNLSPTPGVGPLNILLLDRLDMMPKDQGAVRLGLLKFIDNAKPGTRMALFAMGDRLEMLHGFTDDREALKTALMKMEPASPKLSDAVNKPSLGVDESGFGPTALGAGPANVEPSGPEREQRARLRVRLLTATLRELARYGAGLPGRKNLLWFSGQFPMYVLIKPGCNAMSDPACDLAVVKEFRQAADMLAASQVAVYPVDARGIKPITGKTMSAVMRQGEAEFNNATNQDEMGTMTGGRSFENVNNFDEITAEAIDDGSNYYTIAYSPSDMRWNGDYRKIKVQVNREGLELSYRQGFYADDPNAPAKAVSKPAKNAVPIGAEAAAMSTAMKSATEYGSPDATQIVFTARVLPTSSTDESALAAGNRANVGVKGPYRRYAVDFSVDPHAIAGEEFADGVHHAMVEFVTFVYEADAKLVNTVGMTLKADIPKAALAEGSKERVPAHEEISVPAKGDYFLHIAVHDLTNDHVGSIEVPVSAVRGLPAAGK